MANGRTQPPMTGNVPCEFAGLCQGTGDLYPARIDGLSLWVCTGFTEGHPASATHNKEDVKLIERCRETNHGTRKIYWEWDCKEHGT